MVTAAVGEIWQYVRSSYGADILSTTERPCITLDKIIITIIIVVVFVTDYSDSEPRLRRLEYHRSLRPDFEMSRWHRRRRLFFSSSWRQVQYERRMRILV